MELYQLRTFVAIAREQNLTRAAESLHLSQSAISSQIKALEAELGVRLFLRGGRGMTLSEPGRILLGYAHGVIEAADALKRTAETLKHGTTASVSIGLNTDPTFLRVSEINKRLALLHSDLNVIFHASETANTAQRLRNGLIDLGFFYGDLTDPDIAHTIITQVRICVVIPTLLAPAGQPSSWQEIANLPWVWVDDKFPFYRVMQEKMGSFKKAPGKIATAANEQIVHELVLAGQGVAIMREDEALPLAERGKVLIWDKGWGSIPLRLGWKKENGVAGEEGRGEMGSRSIVAARDAINHVWWQASEDEYLGFSDKIWA